jgi:hypothetical protein
MLSFVTSLALMVAGSATERGTPEDKTSGCKIVHDPARYLGRRLVLEARVVDASPHTIYITDAEDSSCILSMGSMAAGEEDLFDFADETKVRIHAILKSEMRNNPFTGDDPRSTYLLDEMRITRLQP